MEWINDYWYVLVVGLVAVMILFGHKTKGSDQEHQHASHNGGKEHKGGGGCCH